MRLRLMRGQVAVREIIERRSSGIWTPQPNERKVRTHRGLVLAIGSPSRAGKSQRVEVAYGFAVGDIVQYHLTIHQEAWTFPWPQDGVPAQWVPQNCIDAVIDSSDSWEFIDALNDHGVLTRAQKWAMS